MIWKIVSKSLLHVRESGLWNLGNFCLWNPELSRILLVGSRIQLKESGIPLAIGVQFQWQRQQSRTWNPESKTIVDFLTLGERVISLMRRGPSHSCCVRVPNSTLCCTVLQLHTILVISSCTFIPSRQGAFCALNGLLLLLTEIVSFVWLQRLAQRSNNAFTVLITASESQCGNFYPFKNRYW